LLGGPDAGDFPDERFGAALLLYIVLNQIAGGLYFAWRRRHRMRPAPRLA
jgi:hypothetical protein